MMYRHYVRYRAASRCATRDPCALGWPRVQSRLAPPPAPDCPTQRSAAPTERCERGRPAQCAQCPGAPTQRTQLAHRMAMAAGCGEMEVAAHHHSGMTDVALEERLEREKRHSARLAIRARALPLLRRRELRDLGRLYVRARWPRRQQHVTACLSSGRAATQPHHLTWPVESSSYMAGTTSRGTT
jgi:hypothetical protein